MKAFSLEAQLREAKGKLVAALREQGMVPGVVYGPEIKENVLIQLPKGVVEKVYAGAGKSAVVMLTVPGYKEPLETLIKDIEIDPVMMNITHLDFYKIRAGQKIEVAIPILFINEAPAVKEFGGTLVTSMDEVRVKCLPKDLVESLTVDLSSLKTFDDTIYVKDLAVPASMEVMEDAQTPIASVTPVEVEEVVAPTAEIVMPELAKDKKKGEEGDAAAEGAAPAAGKDAKPAKKA